MMAADIETKRHDAVTGNGIGDMGQKEAKASVIAKGDRATGRLQMEGDGQVQGSFEGQVDCAGEFVVGREARIVASIRTKDITIAGFMRGDIVATGRLRILSSGRLEGDAKVGSLVVQEGGVHLGVIRVHPEGLPTEEAAPPTGEPEPGAGPTSVFQDRVMADPVGRVKKFWGEFF